MRLHNGLSNEECIGKGTCAQPDIGQPWVRYENEKADGSGDPNYYRNVYVGKYCAYVFGEYCEIRGYNENLETVTMYSVDGEASENDYNGIFTIPYEQYVADFGLNWRG